MDTLITAANAGALATLILGILGLLAPAKAARFVSISPEGANGMSEIRATYGGLFVALGAWCLTSQSYVVFTVAGVAWIGAAAGRVFSMFIDKNGDVRNLGGVVLELVIGLLLLSPNIH